jgi:serine/threonine protein kinase
LRTDCNTFLHAQGLAHLDLKPANVVISGEGKAVIIDISGWARTHGYLAPEVPDVFNLAQLGFEVRVKNDC